MSIKTSKYTFLLPQEDNYVLLYNCRTDAIAVIESEVADLLTTYKDNIEKINEIHPSFYEFLIQKKYAVPQEVIEEEEIIKEWKSLDINNKTFSIFINPTLDCNLNCWYCFEKHVRHSMISDEIANRISRLIAHKLTSDKVEYLNLSFFGGEPLIAYQAFISPFLEKVDADCRNHNCQLYVGFVTNATLITDDMLTQLKSLQIAQPVNFQVTLDGNELYHNRVKMFANKRGSYRLIIENIRKIVANDMSLTLRLNMTNENLDSYYDVLDDITSFPLAKKDLITIDLQRVWQDRQEEDKTKFERRQINIREAFLQKGFNVNELKHIDRSRCYADRDNHVTINYDGLLYKCTAKDFSIKNSEGELLPNGTLKWNEKYNTRLNMRYGNDFCRKCCIFPLCHGGCSQYKVDTSHISNQCIRGYDEPYIQKIIEDRAEFLLEQIVNSKQ